MRNTQSLESYYCYSRLKLLTAAYDMTSTYDIYLRHLPILIVGTHPPHYQSTAPTVGAEPEARRKTCGDGNVEERKQREKDQIKQDGVLHHSSSLIHRIPVPSPPLIATGSRLHQTASDRIISHRIVAYGLDDGVRGHGDVEWWMGELFGPWDRRRTLP